MMQKVFLLLLAILLFLLFSCEQAEDPLSADLTGQQINTIQNVSSSAKNIKTSVYGNLWLYDVITWGDQGANPGGRYFVKGLVAKFETNGSLSGNGKLEQFATYDENFSGPTHGSLQDWTIDWNGEEVILSGRFQGKSYWNEEGKNILETKAVLKGECSTGPILVKMTIIGESLGLFEYSGILMSP